MNLRTIVWKQIHDDEKLCTRWSAMLPVLNNDTGKINHHKIGYIIKQDDSNLFYIFTDLFTQNIIRACQSQPTAKLSLEEAMIEFFTSIQRCVDTIFEPDVIESNGEPTESNPT